MPNFKIVVSDPKTRKAYQKEVEQVQSGLVGKKIGDKVSGSNLGLAGYELEITGGSDKDGFPMRRDVEGMIRKKILLANPPGFHPEVHGMRKRKSIRGNTVSADISQVNIKVVKEGGKALDELIGSKPKEEAAKEEKAAEKPKKEAEEKPKEQAGKAEAKPAEKKEKPKADKEEKAEEKPEEQAEKAEAKMGVKKLE